MRILVTAAVLVALLSTVAGCGDRSPGKEGLVQLLRDMEAAIAKGDIDTAYGYMVPFPNIEPAKMKQSLASVAEREGLTKANIDELEAKAKYGPLTEVFPERGERWAKRVNIDPAQCYALSAGSAEVGAHWDGSRFRLFRLDNLNKIGAN